ncbi:MAG: sigma-54 dependent transcriptional regulator [Flavobacteriaceae bacterium]|nr:sigma-54 dependent transcriptional regulator [Flavobacteriaceae bacterium]
MKSIYLIDDDVFFNKKLTSFLKDRGYFVISFVDAESAFENLDQYIPDLIVTDLRLPGMDGIEFLKKVKLNYHQLPVILITNYSDVRTAVQSIKIGAYEYVSKPVKSHELLSLIEKAIELSQQPNQEHVLASSDQIKTIIKSKNKKMKATWELIDKVAPTDMSVFIHGESGTGKEYVARYIHSKSKRFGKPFVVVDCGSITENNIDRKLFGAHGSNKVRSSNQLGFFEKANGGTIFFDEIINLSPSNQIKILRVIQEKKIEINQVQINLNIRFITSVNVPVESAIEQNRLREDLYFRLNEFPIRLSPLRERKEDLVDFIDHFINESSVELKKKNVRLKIDLIQDFRKYTWPGNLRELKNFIKRGVLLTEDGVINYEHLPDFNNRVFMNADESKLDLKTESENLEKRMIMDALTKNRYNKSKTAKELNITRSTLYKKMEYFGIE